MGYNGLINDFQQAADPRSNLARYGIAPTYPLDFAADVKNNALPKVSWVLPGFLLSEHPALPVSIGAVGIVDVLRILLSNPAVWEKTAVIVNYDENGGFFDHVTPPTPPPGTPGSTSPSPISTRYRVRAVFAGPSVWVFAPVHRHFALQSRSTDGPRHVRPHVDAEIDQCAVRSARSQPQRLEKRRGRRYDFDIQFRGPAEPVETQSGSPAAEVSPQTAQCVPNAVLGTTTKTSIPYRVPFPQMMPTQETSPTRGIPSGVC
ncbi:phosphoesterase family protein [Mycobacterium kansasii]|uniref:Phosphoesterase family protein n=1 Tax=Mycobacterium kansasii TaxID=1768 RepID=A0A1V3WYI1_MYCKA|nr:phosphoesterase family protein [Mycobacterium kansasii]